MRSVDDDQQKQPELTGPTLNRRAVLARGAALTMGAGLVAGGRTSG